MKTRKGWDESQKNLDDYLPHPCEIDEALYMYIAECVMPNYLEGRLVQGGDPTKSIEDVFSGNEIYYYSTVNEVDGKYYYLGDLPEFKQFEN